MKFINILYEGTELEDVQYDEEITEDVNVNTKARQIK